MYVNINIQQVDDKIQMKYEVKVTACGTGRPCRSDRYKIGGMMEVESRSRIRREVKSSSRVKREVESSSRIRREVLDYLGRFAGFVGERLLGSEQPGFSGQVCFGWEIFGLVKQKEETVGR